LLTGDSIFGSGTGSVADALAYIPGSIVIEPWRLVTNAFVHASLIHIAVNMYSLFVLGVPLERFLGRGRFIALYLIGTLGADVGVDFLSHGSAIGASGAIFALLGTLILFSRRLGFSPTWLIVIGVVNLVYGFVAAGISWQAHLGGLVAGLLIGVLLLLTRSERRRGLQVAGLIVLPVVFLLALLGHVLL
jgi:membrane associated rhomboid family serine protease